MTASGRQDRQGWSFASAREPAFFTACEQTDTPGVGHALAAGGTLCGIPEDRLTVYRSPFFPSGETACARCAALAAEAPSRPGVQERLHERVRCAQPGVLREEVLAALLQGADVKLWINGPSKSLIRHYAQLDRIVEGGEPIEAVVRAGRRLGLARVVHGSREFVVFLPEDDRPFVTRAQPA
ncbi:hypothetical protein [Streptomyces griseus]|uniref:hypothetical protein n=1 Tax=Streptomyces griseus TaxID=1911 RepID=UPI000A4CF703|nr:hypothetical protein [Streptomyces griseus]